MVVVQAFADIPRNLNPGSKVWIYSEDPHYSQVTIETVLPYKMIFRIFYFRRLIWEISDKNLEVKHNSNLDFISKRRTH